MTQPTDRVKQEIAALTRFAEDVQREPAERAAALLTAHQRRDAGGCLCGWGVLGMSHALHQADALARAGLLGVTPRASLAPTHLPGDGPCHDCGGTNIVWSTDSTLWNLVIGGPAATDDPGGLLCVPCFVGRAEALGLAPAGWYLGPWQPAADPGRADQLAAEEETL